MLQRSPATPAAPASFGAMLRFLRRRARLTQADLGIAVGYSDAQICRLETGRRLPDLTALAALFLPALGLDPHGEDARRLLALAALAAAESQRPPPRALLRIAPARLARPAEEYEQLLEECIALAEEADRALERGGDQADWGARLELEVAHDRARIALGWAQARGDLRGLRLAAPLWRLWYSQGHLREGRRWLEIFVALPGAADDPLALARALDAAGLLAERLRPGREVVRPGPRPRPRVAGPARSGPAPHAHGHPVHRPGLAGAGAGLL
jgi:transcriptional regulator with XRE-family HTH domain